MHDADKTELIYGAIIAYKSANDGNSPTVRHLSNVAGIGLGTTHYHLAKLVLAERIIIGRGARSIQVVGGEWRAPCQLQST